MSITEASYATTALPLVRTPAPVSPEHAAGNRSLIQAVKAVNQAETFGDNYEITFQFDRNSRLPVIRIVNRGTNDVVEQIPAEYILQLAESLGKGESSTVSMLG